MQWCCAAGFKEQFTDMCQVTISYSPFWRKVLINNYSCNVTGFNLHPLKGDRAGEWTITMAYRFGRLFNMDPSTWIRKQEAVDAWDTLESHRDEYEKIHPISK